MNVSNRRIAFVIGSMGNGGAERVVSIMANSYAQQGWQVDILMLLSNQCTYQLETKINLIDLSGKGSSRIAKLPHWLKKIQEYARIQKPDVVVSFVARINIITQVALRHLDIPVIVSERNDPYKDGRGCIVDFMTKWLYPKTEKVVFQTKRAQSYFPKLDNACIIPNPVEIHASRKNEIKNRIVTVGRLAEQKNQKLLISAFAQVYSKYPDYTLDIYGEGHLRDSLQQFISELKLDDCVSLKGNVPDIHQQIADAKLFVLSSDYEGLSNALLEAMMMGLPCISTNCAGSDEYIQQGYNGLLTNIGDSVELADAIVYMITHPDEANQMGSRAKELSKSFAKQSIIKQWTEVVETAIN